MAAASRNGRLCGLQQRYAESRALAVQSPSERDLRSEQYRSSAGGAVLERWAADLCQSIVFISILRFLRNWHFAILCLIPEGVGPPGRFGYLVSSARTRITSAIMKRQSMAIVIVTRIQDDFSSNHLTSFVLARPAGRSRRPADRRPDLPGRSSTAAAPTLAKKALRF